MRLLSDNDVLPLATQPDFVADGKVRDYVDDSDCGPMLRAYVALTDGRIGADLTLEDRVYNRYFWFCRFVNRHRAKFGYDAGIDQQALQILEYANCDIDLSKINELEAAARVAAHAPTGIG